MKRNKLKLKRLLIIPARSGSRRIINKNIKRFFKRPIYEYGLNVAKKSKLFETIHISTNDKKLIKILKNHQSFDNFKRPNYLSDDKTPLVDVIKFVNQEFEKKDLFHDEIWILLPCSPLVEVKDLKRGANILKKNSAFTTVGLNRVPIQWSYEIKSNILHPLKKSFLKKQSQNLKKTYSEIGVFAGWKTGYFKKIIKKKRDFRFYPLILSFFKSFDIDTLDDWKIVEKIYKFKLHK